MPNHCTQRTRNGALTIPFGKPDHRTVTMATLLGTAAVFFAPAASAAPSTIEVVYSFAGGADGRYPEEALIEHSGVLYGTTFNGGSVSDCGTVFGLTRPPGVKTFTEAMTSQNGCGPKSLAVGTDGNLYGVNETAGVASSGAVVHQGTAFRITTGGALTRLHLFDSTAPSRPEAGLLASRNGALFGTTSYNNGVGSGTVFRLTPQAGSNADVSHLHGFSAAQLSKPGSTPLAKLIEDATLTGTFYGSTSAASPSNMNAGTLFRITADGTYRLLWSFDRENERASGPLAHASDGRLYGTTSGGGAHGQGMVFRLATDGTGYQELHAFNAATDQLSKPHGGLIVGTDGNLYGVAGGVFRVTPGTGQVARLIPSSTVKSVVATRVSGNELDAELSGLLQGTDGSLYAASKYGGTTSCTETSSVPGTWGCGAVVKIVAGDATTISSGSGGNPGGGNPGGGTPPPDNSDSGGGGDGAALTLLLALLAMAGLRRRTPQV